MSGPSAIPSSSVAPVLGAHPHRIRALPVLVLFPHNRCNCRCVMCDIWRIRQAREITARDLEPHLESIRALGVRWVVFSGGEPQMNTDLPALSRMLRAEGIRLTLLTAGLLLEPQARSVAGTIDDVIVSLDGPREIHDRIRRVPRAFGSPCTRGAALQRSLGLRRGGSRRGRAPVFFPSPARQHPGEAASRHPEQRASARFPETARHPERPHLPAMHVLALPLGPGRSVSEHRRSVPNERPGRLAPLTPCPSPARGEGRVQTGVYAPADPARAHALR